ncbi:hypothetical protein Y032_0019g3913 [Ancylostoma ceylanicum]|uniref:Uncharacterized protein n=1 Tax=Ancylostoma ceylanicum TaxID=53326 RepID=A0A016V1S3_9BILA|nr:hypothetical protein Y032_0019g3913 [Ancylostoma ceylanicum]
MLMMVTVLISPAHRPRKEEQRQAEEPLLRWVLCVTPQADSYILTQANVQAGSSAVSCIFMSASPQLLRWCVDSDVC